MTRVEQALTIREKEKNNDGTVVCITRYYNKWAVCVRQSCCGPTTYHYPLILTDEDAGVLINTHDFTTLYQSDYLDIISNKTMRIDSAPVDVAQ